MTNEFGVQLDRNGYSPSIIPGHSETSCFLCSSNGSGKMDRHEAFFGPYRSKSKRLGLWVNLCHFPCHLYGVHQLHYMDVKVKQAAQKAAMEHYGWSVEDFIREFGKSYIWEE